ncbi:MAG: hypothetical protein KR126chlam1_01061 [Chlamydiae bacterium]|nr:hypothetical protein [Chlamydiota bacterium]
MIQPTSLHNPIVPAHLHLQTVSSANRRTLDSSLQSLNEGDARGIFRRVASSVGHFFYSIFSLTTSFFWNVFCCACLRKTNPRLEQLERDDRKVVELIKRFPQEEKLKEDEDFKKWWKGEFGKLDPSTRKALLWIHIQQCHEEPDPKLLPGLFSKFPIDREGEAGSSIKELIEQIQEKKSETDLKPADFKMWWKDALDGLSDSAHQVLLREYAAAKDNLTGDFDSEKYNEFANSAKLFVIELSEQTAMGNRNEVMTYSPKEELPILLGVLHKRLSEEIAQLS